MAVLDAIGEMQVPPVPPGQLIAILNKARAALDKPPKLGPQP